MWFSNGLNHKLKGYKKGGIIAESKHINIKKALCPKCDLMRGLLRNKNPVLRNKTAVFPVKY
jgi:hypothetical protein